jgi:hypothetical protein
LSRAAARLLGRRTQIGLVPRDGEVVVDVAEESVSRFGRSVSGILRRRIAWNGTSQYR